MRAEILPSTTSCAGNIQSKTLYLLQSKEEVTMAEKEERILIKKQINYHPPYGGWCGNGKEIVFTRQEAIERIAKKICAYSWETLNELAQARYMERAEAALNALLEEK